jgi:hypothetical protein
VLEEQAVEVQESLLEVLEVQESLLEVLEVLEDSVSTGSRRSNPIGSTSHLRT